MAYWSPQTAWMYTQLLYSISDRLVVYALTVFMTFLTRHLQAQTMFMQKIRNIRFTSIVGKFHQLTLSSIHLDTRANPPKYIRRMDIRTIAIPPQLLGTDNDSGGLRWRRWLAGSAVISRPYFSSEPKIYLLIPAIKDGIRKAASGTGADAVAITANVTLSTTGRRYAVVGTTEFFFHGW